jgi:Leucine-rich repeat (LRR) protein
MCSHSSNLTEVPDDIKLYADNTVLRLDYNKITKIHRLDKYVSLISLWLDNNKITK